MLKSSTSSRGKVYYGNLVLDIMENEALTKNLISEHLSSQAFDPEIRKWVEHYLLSEQGEIIRSLMAPP